MRFLEFANSNRNKQILLCGGNVFKGTTSTINRENIGPTLEKYFEELKGIFPQKAAIFNSSHFHSLGSVGKKSVSGDIDLGIDISSILDKDVSDQAFASWNLDPTVVRADAENLAKRARTATPEQLLLKAFFRQLTIYINDHAPSLYTDEKRVSAGNIFGLFPQYDVDGNKLGTAVQIDWMAGNLGWLKFSYHSSAYPEGSNVKGLHRTQMILASFVAAGFTFNHVSGVRNKETGEVVATTPEEALAVLSDAYNVAFTTDITEDYYKLHALLKTLAKHNTIMDIYLKILDKTRADIPDDMQEYWVANQSRLGLTGKFLPANSAIAQHRTMDAQ